MALDLLIRGGTIVDGTRAPKIKGDVGVLDGRIAYIGNLVEGVEARRTVDASGKIVCPGFIDIHSHSDFVVADPDHEHILSCFLRQGVTTLVTGNCGFAPAPISDAFRPEMNAYTAFLRSKGAQPDWPTMNAYLEDLERNGVALNVVPLAAHGALRIATMGFAKRAPDGAELRNMQYLLSECLEAGAFGLSAGLGYAPGMYAETGEIVSLGGLVGKVDGLFTCHSRGLSETLVEAMGEVVDVCTRGKVRGQFSHLCALGESNWPLIGKAIGVLEMARSRGIDIATDCQAYVAGNTTLTALLPPWALEGGMGAIARRIVDPVTRAHIRNAIENEGPSWPVAQGGWTDNMIASLGYDNIWLLTIGSSEFETFEGLSLAATAERIGRHPFDATMDLIVAGEGKTMMLVVGSAGSLKSDAPLRQILKLPYTALETDAIVTGEGKPNRGAFGAYPRMLGHFVRDQGLMSLEQAVYQMSGLAADRLGLSSIGRLRSGSAADIVVLDFDQIADTTTYFDTASTPKGIEFVFVNGVEVVSDGDYRPRRAGRVYRRAGPR
jgi:N-acyl-D-aspartate/D-glutamate deacylase